MTDQIGKAAEIWMHLGDRDRALKCYRSMPDFSAALNLVRHIENHPARPCLEWLAEVDAFSRLPDNFNRTMTAPEKKFLEAVKRTAPKREKDLF